MPYHYCNLFFLFLFSKNTEGVNYAEIDAKDPETLTEEEKIALLGRPVLGDVTKIQIRIRESKEFKVGCYKLGKKKVLGNLLSFN